jgi:hypothetical protein
MLNIQGKVETARNVVIAMVLILKGTGFEREVR